MKYISIFLILCISVFSFDVSAWFFDGNSSDIPYCTSWNDCGLTEWVEAIESVSWTSDTASVYIQNVVGYVLGFLALIATIIIIYAWFNLLTWIWDEEKAKKTKQIIIYAIWWILLIYLAAPIIKFVLEWIIR